MRTAQSAFNTVSSKTFQVLEHCYSTRMLTSIKIGSGSFSNAGKRRHGTVSDRCRDTNMKTG